MEKQRESGISVKSQDTGSIGVFPPLQPRYLEESGHREQWCLPTTPARYLETLNNWLLPPYSPRTEHRKSLLSCVALPRLEKLRWDILQPWSPQPLHEGIQQVTSIPYIVAVCQTKGHKSPLPSETEMCQATEFPQQEAVGGKMELE